MAGFGAAIAQAYATEGAVIDLGRGVHEGALAAEAVVRLPLATMNRHGLIAGATGTGKTKTLQLITEQLSAQGVPVFVADVKGDLSGLAEPAEAGGPAEKRMGELGLPFAPAAFPVEFLSLGGIGPGVPVRATVSDFGPQLLAKVLEQLPEAGDVEKPKLVFFLDEAHLLFADATDAFVESLTRTVRLIRSKGVGVFFVTQAPTDLPESVLGQLGSRVQHALRAFTPKDAKDLRAVVSTYPTSDFYDVGELLTSMGTGEAAVTLLSEKGVPTPVVHTRMRAPASKMAPIADVDGPAKASPLFAKYGARVDAQSAREILAGRLEAAREPVPAPAPEHIPAPKLPKAPRRAPAPDPGGIGDFLNSRQGKAIQREVIRGVFGMLRRQL